METPDNKNIWVIVFKIWAALLGSSKFQFWSISNIDTTICHTICLSCLPHYFCLNLPLPTETPLQNNPYRFPYFVLTHSTTCHHKYWLYQTIWQVKPIKFIIKLYPDDNKLWAKQKAESLRTVSPSKLDNTVNNNSIFNTKYAEFSTTW